MWFSLRITVDSAVSSACALGGGGGLSNCEAPHGETHFPHHHCYLEKASEETFEHTFV